ncbi:electron transport complex subunit RsxG [Candidatus Albibeggiatoa sp. nov. NOAA]|uniref:electron transport complex subunit RsxG n=1 Tax=Candidatus Albibeggiatoa sp. nov. NOAA TaxID=3162724 RepID=UPI0032FCA2A3|nr:electron transport complex subunit RsxG [Thiotrichaceae bacterium]
MLLQMIKKTAIALVVAAILGSGLVALSYQVTHEQIISNQRAALIRSLSVLINEDMYDNDLVNDIAYFQDRKLLGTDDPIVAYRARLQDRPIATVLSPIAPDGYNGKIHLLVGVDYNGTLIGVRVVSHQETPGLGDMIDARRSNWILSFNGLSLNNLTRKSWNVKRDGGIFDQFTGATITPRAVVKAVHNALLFYEKHKTEIFETETASMTQ